MKESTALKAEIRCRSSDGHYTLTVATDEAANGRVTISMSYDGRGEPTRIYLPPVMARDMARLLASWLEEGGR